jgi:hypothetical protein
MCGEIYDGNSTSKFCSNECKELYNMYEKEKIDAKINKSNDVNNTSNLIEIKEEKKPKTYTKTCKNCGKEFKGYKTAQYCSKECKIEFNVNKKPIQNPSNIPFEPKKLSNNLSKNNKSGYRGVYFDEAKGKWRAQIRFNKKCHKLGLYEDKLDAIKARQKSELEFYGKILDIDSSEGTNYNQIVEYISSMEDMRLIQLCNDIYDFVNNDFYILYKQFEENISSIEELQNLFLQESNKRFYKLNKVNRMLNKDIK